MSREFEVNYEAGENVFLDDVNPVMVTEPGFWQNSAQPHSVEVLEYLIKAVKIANNKEL